MVLRNLSISLLLLLLLPLMLLAQDTLQTDTLTKRVTLVEDDPVVSMLDSLATIKIFEDAANPNANNLPHYSDFSDPEVPFFTDSVYRERIAQMNDQSPFEYIYNIEVRKFIELYAVRKRKLTARILGLAQIYFPLFEEQLDKFNMPLELKYLAVIESALNPTANSKAGAKGLWQFMYGTGRVYGLKVSSYVDDRYDPYKATIAACQHLQDLYDIYGNWSLALAAYNSGAGNVNKAIRRSGGLKNFWAIHNYLPRETRSYVPAFIAASYVLNYSKEHKINPVNPGILYYEVDTVTVRSPLTFAQIAEMLNIPMEEVEFLNPSFKQGVIPASSDNTYKLRLRKKYIGDFINNEYALYSYRTKKGLERDSLLDMVNNSYRETQLYTVKSGETMGSVAKKFNMTVGDLKSLNSLRKNYIKPKQKLLVFSKPNKEKNSGKSISSTNIPASNIKDTANKPSASVPDVSQNAPTSKPVVKNTGKPENRYSFHVVKRGESLGILAQKYHCTIDQLQKWNNLTNNNIVIGQKLKVITVEGEPMTMVKPESGTGKTNKPANAGNQKFTYYTIQSGDNLWDIADKFDITVSQLKNFNNIKNASRLKPGQKLKIPR